MDNMTLTPLAENTINKSSLKVGRKLGEGGVAEVFECNDKDGNKVALRQLQSSMRFKFEQKKNFLKGVELRRCLGRHPNVVQYIGEGVSMMLPYEVIEFVPGMPLKQAIMTKNEMVWNEPLLILRQAAAAMIHVHNVNHLHLDIKPENYFIYEVRGKPVIKLTDFDMCLPSDSKVAPAGYGGTPVYLPPEYHMRKEVSVSTDIFSFGVLAYNLYSTHMPFIGSVMEGIDSQGRYQIRFAGDQSERMTESVQDFIRKCLAPTPAERYGNGYELFIALEEMHKAHLKMRRPPPKTPGPPAIPGSSEKSSSATFRITPLGSGPRKP